MQLTAHSLFSNEPTCKKLKTLDKAWSVYTQTLQQPQNTQQNVCSRLLETGKQKHLKKLLQQTRFDLIA